MTAGGKDAWRSTIVRDWAAPPLRFAASESGKTSGLGLAGFRAGNLPPGTVAVMAGGKL